MDRVRLTGTVVERKGFVDYFGNPSSREMVGAGLKCRNVVNCWLGPRVKIGSNVVTTA